MLGMNFSCSATLAESPVHFPWCPPGVSMPAGGGAPSVYRVLPSVLQDNHHREAAPVALQPRPAKSGYAYGWFGSDPSHSWGRHFGVSKNYTQWTRR